MPPVASSSTTRRHPTPPVFHPDHPHNRPPLAHAQTSPLMARNLNVNPGPAHPNSYRARRTPNKRADMSDSDTFSSPSPVAKGRCFCGKDVEQDSLYCSLDCARSDAFSSLCYKPAGVVIPPPPSSFPPSLASSISAGLSRNPSTCSTATTSSQASYSDEWTASHYRRMAHADMRRDERREERRRRRAEGSMASSTLSSSTSSSRVPELVGGGHTRNISVASTSTSVSSIWSSSLSRNPSLASSTSSRRQGAGVHVDTMIMEDEDEEAAEWLSQSASHMSKPYGSPVPRTPGRGHKRRHSSSKGGLQASASKQTKLEPTFGLGKDMRDVLEEIISMEKEFMLSEDDEDDATRRMQPSDMLALPLDRPPRTPSPGQEMDRPISLLPAAPGAPTHARHESGSASFKRPTSLRGLHQSSLSESHTALYLATASPVLVSHAHQAANRRSASPALEARRSITFDASSAGPAIASIAPHASLPSSSGGLNDLPMPNRRMFDSPASSVMSITPQSRRPQISPHAVHPAMDGWKFPSPAAQAATPTKGAAAQAQGALPFPSRTRKTSNDAYTTPQHQRFRPHVPRLAIDTGVGHARAEAEPHLLWPPPSRPLAPALFPCSPANATPEMLPAAPRRLAGSQPIQEILGGGRGQERALVAAEAAGVGAGAEAGTDAPPSGMRLGVLLGSGSDVDPDERRASRAGSGEGEMDVDMDDDDSTAHGHGFGVDGTGTGTGYLPVFLEAEGFRQGWRRY